MPRGPPLSPLLSGGYVKLRYDKLMKSVKYYVVSGQFSPLHAPFPLRDLRSIRFSGLSASFYAPLTCSGHKLDHNTRFDGRTTYGETDEQTELQ